MTEIEKKRQWLAVNVMGWELCDSGNIYAIRHPTKGYEQITHWARWKPEQEIAQAMGLLDKYGYYDLSKDGYSNMCLVATNADSDDPTSAQSDESKEDAIIEAVLQASGYYE